MRVKVFFEVDRQEFVNSCLFDTLTRVKMARWNFAFKRKTFFPGQSKGIPFSQEIVFATLYEKIGRDNHAVRSLKKFRCEYLAEIRQIWSDYYNSIARHEAGTSICIKAEKQKTKYQHEMMDIECAISFFEAQRKRTFLKWPESINEFVSSIQSGNFLLFYDLFKRSGMNRYNTIKSGRYRHNVVREFNKAKTN